jgi:hypothetical protein
VKSGLLVRLFVAVLQLKSQSQGKDIKLRILYIKSVICALVTDLEF